MEQLAGLPEATGAASALAADRSVLGELFILKDSVAGREELEKHLEVRRAQEVDGEWKHIRRVWCLGSETFRQELLAQAQKRAGDERIVKLQMNPEEQCELKLEMGTRD